MHRPFHNLLAPDIIIPFSDDDADGGNYRPRFDSIQSHLDVGFNGIRFQFYPVPETTGRPSRDFHSMMMGRPRRGSYLRRAQRMSQRARNRIVQDEARVDGLCPLQSLNNFCLCFPVTHGPLIIFGSSRSSKGCIARLCIYCNSLPAVRINYTHNTSSQYRFKILSR